MSKITLIGIIIAVILIFITAGHGADISKYGGKEASVNKYYTYGINDDYIDKYIEPGEILTNVKVIFVNITNVAENPDDTLHIYLCDNPPLGMISNIDGDPNNSFFGYSPGSNRPLRDGLTTSSILQLFSPLTPAYKDTTPGTENLVYNLIDIDDPNSWAWDVFQKPFIFQTSSSAPNNTVTFSSMVLEFIDYAGNSTPVGFGFDPTGTNGFTFDEIIVELTIERYEGTYEKRIVPIRFTKPPMIIE